MYVKIKADIKEAMKNKNTVRRDALKIVVDKARGIQKKMNPVDAPDMIPDDIMTQAIQMEMKQLTQTKTILEENGKETTDLYIQTIDKMAILCAYLPTQMTKEEVENAVSNIISNGNYPNFGMKMKAVMAELKGKADNKLIKEVVETYK